MLGQAADPVPFVGLRTGIQLARPLVSQSARLPGLPGVLQASEPPAQRASTSPDASCALVAGASSSQVVRLTPHRGGKRPVPQFGQVPYSRLSVTSCPPAPCSFRCRFPRACNGVLHTGQLGRSCGLAPLQARLVLCWAVSRISRASNRLILSWTSSSISRKVALGWLCRHSVISVRICSLRSRQCSSGVLSISASTFCCAYPSLFFSVCLSPLQKSDAHSYFTTCLIYYSQWAILVLEFESSSSIVESWGNMPSTSEPTRPLEIFYSYAHEDERLLKDLNNHLFNLKRQGLIVDWYDRDISAGTDWEQEIDNHLNTAQVILLLISPGFMASDYCSSIEMK